jgi:sulfite exporter TauE/SafE
MDDLRAVAHGVVGRGYGFMVLGIGMTMVGFSFNLLLALKIGAVLFTIGAVIFVLCGLRAPRRPYQRTELWVSLPEEKRPHRSMAQWAASTVLTEAYFRFAQHSAVTAVALWLGVIVLPVLKVV